MTAVRVTAFLACLSLGLAVSGMLRGANLIINGEFDAGLSGWNHTGTVFDTGQTAVLSDQGGQRVILFQTAAVPLVNTASLQLSFDFLNALSPAVGLGQTPDSIFVTALIGSVEFGSDFATGIFASAIGVLDADYRGATNFAPGTEMGPSPKGSGWTRFTMPLPRDGFVTVAFEFIDGNAVIGDSTGAFDNIRLDTVLIPEPSRLTLGAAGVILILRRRRQAL